MALARPCLGCGRLVRGASRCDDCTRQRGRQRDRQRGTRQQRGYTAAHDRLRAQLVAALDPAAPCPRCRRPLGGDPSVLDLMHTDDRSGWLGLGHASCNRATAGPPTAVSPWATDPGPACQPHARSDTPAVA